jgi:hypothetical protein
MRMTGWITQAGDRISKFIVHQDRDDSFFSLAGCGFRREWGGIMMTILFHPALTFAAGAILAVIAVGLLAVSCTPANTTVEIVETYRQEMERAGTAGPAPGTVAERQALERFTKFLQNIGSEAFILENTRKTYSENAFLNDTLVTHRGAEDIEAYFVQTSRAMTHFEVSIDDMARSGSDHYIRWTMIFAAPALAKGEKVHSTGISQVRFTADGKVAFHQDFWDSGENFFGRLPVAGGAIGIIRKRLQ